MDIDTSLRKFIQEAKLSLSRLAQDGQSLKREEAVEVIEIMKGKFNEPDNIPRSRRGSAFNLISNALNEFDPEDEGLTDEDYIDYIDTIHDILDEIEKNNYEDTKYQIKSNMSPNLLRLFGRKEGFEPPALPDNWERPKTYGLSNSAPIIPNLFKDLTLRKFVKAVKVQVAKIAACSGQARQSVSRSTFQSVKTYVKDAYATGLFGEESAIANLKEAMEMISDDSQDLDDDDIEECIQLIREYIDEIEVDFVNDADYEMPENISANLKRLFGYTGGAASNQAPTDWKPPSTYGLGNSAPIIPPKKSGNARGYENTNNNDMFIAESKGTISTYGNGSYKGEFSAVKGESKSGAKGESKGGGYVNDDSDEDDGSDSDKDYEEDFNNRVLKSSNMSMSLMKALGMDVTDKEEVKTSWKPPTFTGVTNSTRIF